MFEFKFCTTTPMHNVRMLLDACELPTSDIDARACKNYLVATVQDSALVGVVGLEKYGRYGLLRSLAVRSDMRSSGLGKELVKRIEANALESGVDSLYLLTTTAEEFFIRLSYLPTNRNTVPSAIVQSSEFSSLCPDNAACLWKSLT